MKRWVALVGCVLSLLGIPSYLQAETFRIAVAADTIDTVVSEVIVKRSYELLGHKVELYHLPPKRALRDANAGKYDGDAQRIDNISVGYPNLIKIEPSINHIQGTGFTHKDTKVYVKTWEDLEAYRVGIILGIRFAEINVPEESAFVFYSYPELTKAINSGKVDIGIYPRSNGIYQGIVTETKNIVPMDNTLAEFKLYHYVHRKNEHLVQGLSKIFSRFKEEGLLEKIRQRVLKISFERAKQGLLPCFKDYACYQSVWDE